jgi:blue copper oxidase
MRKIYYAFLLTVILLAGSSYSQDFVEPMPIPDTISSRVSNTMKMSMDMTHRKFFHKVTQPGGLPFDDTVNKVVGWPNRDLYVPKDTVPVETFSFNAPGLDTLGILGPTLMWYKGDSVFLEITNNLPDTSTVHWHGGHLPPWTDGGPHQPIPPGTTWKPYFKILEDASTMWYHPHLHMMTQMQVQMGLAGMIYVRDPNDPLEATLPHTYGKDDFPIIIQDKAFERIRSLPANHINMTCAMGPTIMVNGTYQPYLNVPDQVVRFRFLNGASERFLSLRIANAGDSTNSFLPFKIIASDGGYLPIADSVGYKQGVPMGSGERYEILFDLTGRDGDTLYLMNMPMNIVPSSAGGPYGNPSCYVANGGNLDSFPQPLMRLIVKHDPTISPAIHSMPTELVNWQIPDYKNPDKTRLKELVFTDQFAPGPPFMIDSLPYNHSFVNDTVILGNTEVWEIKNISGIGHPFHIHDIEFFIFSINGDTNVPAYMRGPKDVVYVQDGQSVKYVTKFEDFATEINSDSCYMYHCHILAHEDHGMMGQFIVTYPQSSVDYEPSHPNEWDLYPNPTSGGLNIRGLCESESVIRIYNTLGIKHADIPLDPIRGSVKLAMPKLTKGMWFIEWKRHDGTLTKQIVVE